MGYRIFNFDDDNVYKENWNNYFKDKNNENCRYTLNDKNISIFQKTKQIDNDTLTVIAHAGDQHSFLGNGCYNDDSAERFLAGYQNFDYLTPVHLLNLFLADIAFTDEEIINLSQSNDKLEIERTYPTKPIIPVDNKENIYLSKINTHYIIGGGILLTLCLATLWIHYKTDFFKDIINQSTNPVQKLEKK